MLTHFPTVTQILASSQNSASALQAIWKTLPKWVLFQPYRSNYLLAICNVVMKIRAKLRFFSQNTGRAGQKEAKEEKNSVTLHSILPLLGAHCPIVTSSMEPLHACVVDASRKRGGIINTPIQVSLGSVWL